MLYLRLYHTTKNPIFQAQFFAISTKLKVKLKQIYAFQQIKNETIECGKRYISVMPWGTLFIDMKTYTKLGVIMQHFDSPGLPLPMPKKIHLQVQEQYISDTFQLTQPKKFLRGYPRNIAAARKEQKTARPRWTLGRTARQKYYFLQIKRSTMPV